MFKVLDSANMGMSTSEFNRILQQQPSFMIQSKGIRICKTKFTGCFLEMLPLYQKVID